jgi:hypothetical protein
MPLALGDAITRASRAVRLVTVTDPADPTIDARRLHGREDFRPVEPPHR